MKLGAEEVSILDGTKLYSAYNANTITERHRSKYTFDRRYTNDMTEHGLLTVAKSASDSQIEGFEWANHPWGIGVQYHPEFVSRPSNPHPLFCAFIKASLETAK